MTVGNHLIANTYMNVFTALSERLTCLLNLVNQQNAARKVYLQSKSVFVTMKTTTSVITKLSDPKWILDFLRQRMERYKNGTVPISVR
jgi:hypothetical protein